MNNNCICNRQFEPNCPVHGLTKNLIKTSMVDNPSLMTDQQESHLKQIKERFYELVDRKYRKGATEHEGDLRDATCKILLDYAIDEAIDQVVYLLTLRDKLL